MATERAGSVKTIKEKYDLIETHERQFAHRLSLQVIDRPRLSVWMILIPIIFVHYFYRFNKFNTGRKEFTKNYLVSRLRALGESLRITETGHKPDIEKLTALASLPKDALPAYRELLRVLIDHYADLLQARGETYEELVRSAYGNRSSFLLFIDGLNKIEKKLDSALKPDMEEVTEGFDEIVALIENNSEKLRREDVERVFG